MNEDQPDSEGQGASDDLMASGQPSTPNGAGSADSDIQAPSGFSPAAILTLPNQLPTGNGMSDADREYIGARGLVPDTEPGQERTQPFPGNERPTVGDAVLAWARGDGVGGAGQAGSWNISAGQSNHALMWTQRGMPGKQDFPSGTPPASYSESRARISARTIVYPQPQGHDPASGPRRHRRMRSPSTSGPAPCAACCLRATRPTTRRWAARWPTRA